MGEECPLRTEGRSPGKNVKAEVTPLELALTEVAPFRKRHRLTVLGFHRQCIAMHKVLRQDKQGGTVNVVRFVDG